MTYYTIGIMTFMFKQDRFLVVGLTGATQKGTKHISYMLRTDLSDTDMRGACRLTDAEE